MNYTVIIVLTAVGFGVLAYILLMPVYRFLKREEQVSKQWTHERFAQRRQQETPSSNGASRRGSDPERDVDPSGDETVR